MRKLKIALVHDFLKEYGGAERVVEALHDIWPEAPIYTSFVDYTSLGPHAERIKTWQIVESPFGSSWIMKKFHSPLRFLAPLVWEKFDFSDFDVVISSSGWYISRGIKTIKPTVHICYLHHPPRHLYGYPTAVEWQKYWPVRLYAGIVNHYLRMYDYNAAQCVDYFIANSNETKRRIEKFYRRDSTVIYPPASQVDHRETLRTVPPVDLKLEVGNSNVENEVRKKKLDNRPLNIQPQHQRSNLELPTSYYLVVSRLARAKHIDLAIKACQELGEPLVIVGKGRDKEYLTSIASSQQSKVTFLGEVADEDLPFIYHNARALVFPAEDEEFGIVPVEAMGYGIPVIAYRSGGVIETVIEGTTGVFFDELTVASVGNAIKYFDKSIYRSDAVLKSVRSACKKQASNFSKERFEKEIREYIGSLV